MAAKESIRRDARDRMLARLNIGPTAVKSPWAPRAQRGGSKSPFGAPRSPMTGVTVAKGKSKLTDTFAKPSGS